MKKNIAILMGGYASEYQVSIKSGNVVYQHLSKEVYNTFRVVIAEDNWYYLSDNDEEIIILNYELSNRWQLVDDADDSSLLKSPTFKEKEKALFKDVL